MKFDEFETGGIAIDDVKARLDNFYDNGLKNKPESLAYIILYRRKCETSRYTLEAFRNYLKLRGLPSRRIKMKKGGYRSQPTVELWVLPKDTHPPTPSPQYVQKRGSKC